MRIGRRLRSGTALSLFALLGMLTTGLPSHHHEPAPADGDSTSIRIDSNHHSHGTQLIEQNERTPSSGVEIAVIPSVSVDEPPSRVVAAGPRERGVLRPRERSPPPGAPRAPPLPL